MKPVSKCMLPFLLLAKFVATNLVIKSMPDVNKASITIIHYKTENLKMVQALLSPTCVLYLMFARVSHNGQSMLMSNSISCVIIHVTCNAELTFMICF